MGHPTGVQPVGLACIGGGGGARKSVRDAGLGDLRALDDELLCRVLEQCAARELVRFSAASRAAYCFANSEDLWRALVLQVRAGACSAVATRRRAARATLWPRDAGLVSAELRCTLA